jgi:hypothetical protein
MTDDLTRFLDVLYGDIDDTGFLELRALPSRRQVWVPLHARHVSGAIEHFLADCQAQQQHAYFGVAVRYRHGGGKDDCSLLTALYCDLDESPAVAHARLDAFPLPPTLVVASGGGLHSYWMLKEPLDLRAPDERDAAERALRRLALALGSDPAVAECARVLRLPGSFNHKPKYGTPPPEVRLVVH